MIELLCNQGIAIIEKNSFNKSDDIGVVSSSTSSELKTIYKSIQKWIDITDEKVN